MLSSDRKLNLVSNGAVESFWDALWLVVWPFSCSMGESKIYRKSIENLVESCSGAPKR